MGGYQERPASVSDARGNFVVVWDSLNGLVTSIYGQRFDASGHYNRPDVLQLTVRPLG